MRISLTRSVCPAIIWADTRSQEQCATLIERIGQEAAYRPLGHRLNPPYSLTKVMWVRDHEPDVFSRTSTVCNAKDFVAYQLTGVLVTDPSDASSTNAFDQQTGTWSAQGLDVAGIVTHRFPADSYEEAFAIVERGECGKVILDW